MAGENTIRGLNDTSSFLEVHENDQEIVFPFILPETGNFLKQLVAEWVFEPKKTKFIRRFIFLLLGPLLFIVLQFVGARQRIPESANDMLSITIWMALWWTTEAIQIGITALLPTTLFPLTGALACSPKCSSICATQMSHDFALFQKLFKRKNSSKFSRLFP